MASSSGVGAGVQGVQASVAALDALTALGALDQEDALLASGAAVGSGVDVLRRRYEIRLERLELAARLEAQLAAM
ncbi:hypothetical protein J2S98_000437, partial [Arthrobacter oryzae]|nr:hypothetical protein [Arthrobacter oryzae]